MRVVFACGGTAGHINPALAIAEKMKTRWPDAEFLFIGSGRVMEKTLIPAEGYPLENLDITGLSREKSLRGLKQNLVTVWKLLGSTHNARKLLRAFRPDIVIGTGGYVCYPVLKAARGLGLPTMIHEANAVPGLTTKLLENTVDRILLAFPDKSGVYRREEKLIYVGTPVRGDFDSVTRDMAKQRLGHTDKPLVVSFWGSLGAERMNRYMEEYVRLVASSGFFYHIHSTGGGEENCRDFCRRVPEHESPYTDVRPYIRDMGVVMTAADLVLCRAGASTLAELTALGRASIIVPSPNVTNDHQTKNARRLEETGAALVREEAQTNGRDLFELSKALVENRMRLIRMERAAASMSVKDSAGKICDIAEELIRG